MKPRIKLNGTLYVCHNDYYITGRGETPLLAFVDWEHRMDLRSRVARRGVWNMQSCRQWFNAGCKAIRVYLGHRQIFGYDPKTDELILRG